MGKGRLRQVAELPGAPPPACGPYVGRSACETWRVDFLGFVRVVRDSSPGLVRRLLAYGFSLR
jgi:hypothetical protein